MMTTLMRGASLYLSFREVERLGQLLALRPDDVVILLESVFQLQQLARREGSSHSLRLAERRQEESGQVTGTFSIKQERSS